MKKLFLFAIFVFFGTIAFCQNDELMASTNKIDGLSTRGLSENTVVYTIGEPKFGYPIESKIVPSGFVTTKDKCPILQYYVKVKKEFIGKKFIDETQKDTMIIKNLKFIEIQEAGSGALVFETNKGKFNFSSDFGYILVENKEMIYLVMAKEKENNFYKILMK